MNNILKIKKLKKRARLIPGASPGTLITVDGSEPSRIFLVAYGKDDLIERPLADIEEIPKLTVKWPIVWMQVTGLGDQEMLKSVAEVSGLSTLSLEDIANQNQRAKIDIIDDNCFISLQGAHLNDGVFEAKQLDLWVRKNLVTTFIETDLEWFVSVQNRIRKGNNNLRIFGSEYLIYAILDTVIDHYFPVLESIADNLYALEQEVFESESYRVLSAVNRERRNLFEIQRALKPMLELVQSLQKQDAFPYPSELDPYFRDLRDHVHMAIDAVEARREHARTIIDMVMSVSNHRMSETMKVLTIIATIFIPLSFIAGVFGMNFDPSASPFNMPELRWKYGYFFALGLMLTVGVGFALYFKKKRWLNNEND
ncbi:MAG: magnesium/cobalt transporter CorA [Deltaproteobacteria bacterium]|nr:magnesium/cobalt transporter CorA [Deltaproteobacteria bacterium]